MNFDFLPNIYTDLFELNCRDHPVPYEKMERFSLEQALKLCDVYEEQVVSPLFIQERVDDIEDIIVDLIFFTVRRNLNLKVQLCKEDRVVYVCFGAGFYAFYDKNLFLLEKITQTAYKVALYDNRFLCIFLLDEPDDE